MGLSPWQKPKHIVDAKRGKDAKANYAMRRGQDLEPKAREAYEKVVGILRPAVFCDNDYGASLDGLTLFEDLVVEIKCPVKGRDSKLWADAVNGRIPDYYLVQMQHQMMVTGIDEAHLWVYDGAEGIAVPLKKDDAIISEIRSAWDKFWSDNLEF